MRFQCPFCRGIVAVENSDMGTDVQCGHCGEVVTVPGSRLATGAVIADFIILEELGRGGMGIVYLAHQISLDRPAAVKILADNFANNAEFVVNFIKEARAAAKLNHPHIVQAYAVGEDEGIFYFAMEHIDGETMKQVLRRDKIIGVEKAITIIQQIAEALDYAWKEARLIHRDIKPDNIMLTKNGRAKLADLGLSKVAGDSDDGESDEVMGTPQYISPEHLTGAPMDVRSDIYSLGATFYHLITGRFPFEGRTATEIARKHLEERLVAPHLINPEIPIAIGQIIEKMMAKNIKNRYQDAEQLVDDLRMVRRGKKPPTATQGLKPLSTQTRLNSATRTQLKTQMRTLNMHLSGMMTGKVMTGTVADLDSIASLEVKRQRRKKMLFIMGIILVLITGVICLQITFSGGGSGSNGNGKTGIKVGPVAGPATGGENGGKSVEQRRETSAYIRKIDRIIEVYQHNQEKKMDLLSRVDDFLEEFPVPHTGAEKDALDRMLKVYIPIDETLRVPKARENLEEKYFQALEKAVLEQQRRLDAVRNPKPAARPTTGTSNSHGSYADSSAAQEKAQLKQRERIFLAECAAAPGRLRADVVAALLRPDYPAATALLAPAANKPGSLPDNATQLEKNAALKLAEWAKMLQQGIKKGERLYLDVYDGGDTLAGTNIEIGVGDLVTVKQIRNRVIDVTPLTGGDVNTLEMEKLPHRIVRQLANKAAKLRDDDESNFFFQLTQGMFSRKLKTQSPTDGWQKEFSPFVVEYLKQKWKESNPSQREELKKTCGSMPEFQEATR